MPVVHRTYAEALFEAAVDKDRLEQVRGELDAFVAATHEVPELRNVLLNPQLDPRAKAGAIEGLLEGGEQILRNFLRLVAEKGRVAELDEIHREFERLVAAAEGQLAVELTTAFELTDEEAKRIVEQIQEASGRTVEATRSVDPSLIGGIVLQAGSLRLDASVRGRLERLRHELLTRT
jgi:F-type H+-transporting ATPase subunit delta